MGGVFCERSFSFLSLKCGARVFGEIITKFKERVSRQVIEEEYAILSFVAVEGSGGWGGLQWG